MAFAAMSAARTAAASFISGSSSPSRTAIPVRTAPRGATVSTCTRASATRAPIILCVSTMTSQLVPASSASLIAPTAPNVAKISAPVSSRHFGVNASTIPFAAPALNKRSGLLASASCSFIAMRNLNSSASSVDSYRCRSPLRGAPRQLLAPRPPVLSSRCATSTRRPPASTRIAADPRCAGPLVSYSRLGLLFFHRDAQPQLVGLQRRLVSLPIPAARGPSSATRASASCSFIAMRNLNLSASSVDSYRCRSPLRGAPRQLLAPRPPVLSSRCATSTRRPPASTRIAADPRCAGPLVSYSRLGLLFFHRDAQPQLVGLQRRLVSLPIPAARGPSSATRASASCSFIAMRNLNLSASSVDSYRCRSPLRGAPRQLLAPRPPVLSSRCATSTRRPPASTRIAADPRCAGPLVSYSRLGLLFFHRDAQPQLVGLERRLVSLPIPAARGPSSATRASASCSFIAMRNLNLSASSVDSYRCRSPLRGAPRQLLAPRPPVLSSRCATSTRRPPASTRIAADPRCAGPLVSYSRLGLLFFHRDAQPQLVGLERRLVSLPIPAARGPSSATRASASCSFIAMRNLNLSASSVDSYRCRSPLRGAPRQLLAPLLVRLRARNLHAALPFDDVVAHVFPECFGRHRHRDRALLCPFRFHVWLARDLRDLCIETADERRPRPLRRDDAEPDRGFVAGDAGLRDGRRVRHDGRANLSSCTKGYLFAGSGLLTHRRDGIEHHIDLTAKHAGTRSRAFFIGHVNDIDARHRLEQFAGHVVGRARP